MASLEALLSGMLGQAAADGDNSRAMLALQEARLGLLSAAGGNGSGRLAAGGPGQGSPGGTNAGSGPGSGASGQGAGGEGMGTGSGSGSGQGAGQGSGAGLGSGNGDSGTGSRSSGNDPAGGNMLPPMKYGEYEKIFDPERMGADGNTSYVKGQAGEGPQQTISTANPDIMPGTLRPYHEVVGEYSREAMDALDRSVIPTGMKDVVRDYFAALEE